MFLTAYHFIKDLQTIMLHHAAFQEKIHSRLDLFSKKGKNIVMREYSSYFRRSKKILNTVSVFAAERKFVVILPLLKYKNLVSPNS